MKELNDIILAYDKAVLQNKQMALVTVVRVDGSSYRRPGARMLVTDDRIVTGAISGGCLEGDALQKAQFAMFQQKNKLEIYDTTDDGNNRLGIQLGCNGIVYILFEPIDIRDPNNPVNLLRKISAQRKDAVLVTLFNENRTAIQSGTIGFFSTGQNYFLNEEVRSLKSTCIKSLENKYSFVQNIGGKGEVLFQFVPPAVHLVIVGAGNDAQSLVGIASFMGWQITVIDGRPDYATKERFSWANKVIVSRPAEILSGFDSDRHTAIVLMTHNYNYDLAVLGKIIHTDCSYIGLLGPKKKLHKMLDELKEKEIRADDVTLQKIYGPVGLDIGAETAEEIAVSIIAEIKAVFSGRKGSFLKDRKTEIHIHNMASHE